MATIQTALDAVDLVKTYRGGHGRQPMRAVDGISLHAEPGTILGLLGPNGAGKSTTVKMLATLTRPDSGSATVAGIDVVRHPDRVRRAIGFVAQKSVCDPDATGVENLLLAGRLQGMTRREARGRAHELLDRFSLGESGGRIVKTYSGGMARKLDVALGLMHRPQVLFLDEPTTALDPEARAEMWAELEVMSSVERMTVLLTTHYLDEADRLADDLAIVDHGRIVVTGTPDELKNSMHGDTIGVDLADASVVAHAARSIAAIPGIHDVRPDGRAIRVRADDGAAALPLVLTALESAAISVMSAHVSRPSLDDVYLRHTGHAFAPAEATA